jgi:hypothetical protein
MMHPLAIKFFPLLYLRLTNVASFITSARGTFEKTKVVKNEGKIDERWYKGHGVLRVPDTKIHPVSLATMYESNSRVVQTLQYLFTVLRTSNLPKTVRFISIIQ